MEVFGEAAVVNRKTKLLVVDDQLETRQLLSQIFAAMGYEVATAADGFGALRQIRVNMPDILLSDLNMPGMSGFELLSVLRRRLPAIYVVATSGAYTGTEIPEGIAADAFYQKATGLSALFEIMRVAHEYKRLGAQQGPSRRFGASTPIWVSVRHGDAYFAIACPECLRVCAHARARVPKLVHEENCSFCDSTIRYAVVEVLHAESEDVYHTELGAGVARIASNA
jgi:CheY-like chemotaxis protein